MEQKADDAKLSGGQLTTVHAVGQSMALCGPIFGAGIVVGLIASVAGFNSPLSVVISAAGAACLAYVVSLFARRFSGAGAIYEYLVHGARPSVGVYAGASYLVGIVATSGCAIFIAFGFLAQDFFESSLSIHVTWWIWAAFALGIALTMNHFGVRLAIRGLLALSALSAIPFLVLAIAIIVQGGESGNTLSAFGTGDAGLSGVLHGVLFGIVLLAGFESAATISEECREPHRSVPIAMLATVALASVFFVLITYAGAIGFGPKAAAEVWPIDPSPMATLAKQYVGTGLETTINLVIMCDAFALSLAGVVGGSRVVFALARDGLLPSAMARTSRTHRTPLGGNVVMAGVGAAAVAFGALNTYGDSVGVPNNIMAFQILSSIGGYLVEGVYALLALFAFRIIWQMSSGWSRVWRLVVAVGGLATPVLAYYGSLNPWPKYPANLGLIFALVALGLITVWFIFLYTRRRERIANAASHAHRPDNSGAGEVAVTSGVQA